MPLSHCVKYDLQTLISYLGSYAIDAHNFCTNFIENTNRLDVESNREANKVKNLYSKLFELWIKKYVFVNELEEIFGSEIEHSYYFERVFDLLKNSQRFLSHLIYIYLERETKRVDEFKQFFKIITKIMNIKEANSKTL